MAIFPPISLYQCLGHLDTKSLCLQGVTLGLLGNDFGKKGEMMDRLGF